MTASTERISLWLAQLRASGRAVLLARLVIAAAGAVALVVPAVQSWDQADLIPLIAVPMLLATVVLPDSPAGLVFLLVVPAGWLMRAPGELSWSLAVTAIALLVVHLATAFAAQVPSYARVHRDALRRWWLPGQSPYSSSRWSRWRPRWCRAPTCAGSLLVTVGALVLATVTIWFAAGQKLGRD